jgi:hypothetical protein
MLKTLKVVEKLRFTRSFFSASSYQMKVLDGDVNIHSDTYKQNLEDMHQINTDLDTKMNLILQGGGERAQQRLVDRGKLKSK